MGYHCEIVQYSTVAACRNGIFSAIRFAAHHNVYVYHAWIGLYLHFVFYPAIPIFFNNDSWCFQELQHVPPTLCEFQAHSSNLILMSEVSFNVPQICTCCLISYMHVNLHAWIWTSGAAAKAEVKASQLLFIGLAVKSSGWMCLENSYSLQHFAVLQVAAKQEIMKGGSQYVVQLAVDISLNHGDTSCKTEFLLCAFLLLLATLHRKQEHCWCFSLNRNSLLSILFYRVHVTV